MPQSALRLHDTIPTHSPRRKTRHLLEEMPVGTFLMTESGLPAEATDGATWHFTPVDDYFIGREDATSGICFGDLTQGDSIVPVAIKPQETWATALNEFSIAQHLNNKGTIPTFEPLGFLRNRHGLHTIARFEQSIISCNTITDHTDDREQLLSVLGFGALTLSSLHASGITHGDAQIKNTAIHMDTRNVWAIDLSSSYFNKGHRGMLDDISSYIGTLPHYVEGDSISSSDTERYFLNPYFELLRDAFSAKRHNEVRSAVRDTLLD